MEENPLYAALHERTGSVVDLIDTNFHRCGFFFPAEPLSLGFSDYLGARRYDPDPRGAVQARRAIAAYYREAGVSADEDDLIMTASTSEAYRLLFTVLCEPGDSVALPWPTYPLFDHLAEHQNVRPVHYRADPKDEFRLSVDAVRHVLTDDVRLLVLISPNNPTGRVIDEATLRYIVELCGKRGVSILCDEVFAELSSEPVPRPSMISDFDVPVYTLNGFSKLFALPDLKVAWILAQNAQASIDELEVANDMYLNCSSFAQHIVPRVFSEGRGFREEMRREVEVRRRVLTALLADMPGGRFVPTEGGIHALYALDRGDDEEVAIRLIREAGVFVHPGYLYGLEDAPHLVLSCLPPVDRLEEGCRRMRAFFER